MNEQFLKRMQTYLQDEYPAYLKTLDEEIYRGVRVNTAKISISEFMNLNLCELRSSSICKESFYIPSDLEGLGNHPAHLVVLYAGTKCF